MTEHYTRSTGERVRIDSMPFPHLKAALAGLKRLAPEVRAEEIAAMEARAAKLEADFRARVEELKALGYAAEHFALADTWVPIGPGDVALGGPERTEDAAWAKIIAHRKAVAS